MLLKEYLDKNQNGLDFKNIFLNKISKIKQPSTQWTCAQLFSELVNQLENKEQKKAKKNCK